MFQVIRQVVLIGDLTEVSAFFFCCFLVGDGVGGAGFAVDAFGVSCTPPRMLMFFGGRRGQR